MSPQSKHNLNLVLIAALVLVVWQWGGGGSPIDIIKPTPKVDAVVYVYEKDDTAIPPGVRAGIDALKRSGVAASVYEDDDRDADGNVPAKYRVAYDAAKETGMPALVATADDEVVKTVKDPQTKEQVVEVAGG